MTVTILWVLTGLAFLYVLFTLIMGAKSMGNKADGTKAISNKWMQRRVIGQAAAIGLLFLTVYVKRKNGL